jgi:hypothetical protein
MNFEFYKQFIGKYINYDIVTYEYQLFCIKQDVELSNFTLKIIDVGKIDDKFCIKAQTMFDKKNHIYYFHFQNNEWKKLNNENSKRIINIQILEKQPKHCKIIRDFTYQQWNELKKKNILFE